MRWWRALSAHRWVRLQGDHVRQQTNQEAGERAADVADPSKRTENVAIVLGFVSKETYFGQVVNSRLWSDMSRWSAYNDMRSLDGTYGGKVMANPILWTFFYFSMIVLRFATNQVGNHAAVKMCGVIILRYNRGLT